MWCRPTVDGRPAKHSVDGTESGPTRVWASRVARLPGGSRKACGTFDLCRPTGALRLGGLYLDWNVTRQSASDDELRPCGISRLVADEKHDEGGDFSGRSAAAH